ncbi:3' exoribonuclease family, domain 1 domain-containing protein [Cardiosporidium cionae]|uniref:3' exoribonuclease family, domain 1 domain-containing protein n=1 Tax=Cardiosporidium cionae TaxID=476202 RepID=A0ABQ7J672_9APIC|nr:3' exoribonuclease family, domain 1 domain-containing protein [Cardiosporidium cionae]|eukprot:KAF8819499.1 3' exoribonuclease family, domain 1 domain-containing protein [Cardiosporidium cionae]
MSRLDFISPEGFRIDGRRLHELRTTQCKLECMTVSAHGSSYFEIGNTRVLAYVYGPSEAKKRSDSHMKGTLHCEVILAAYSTTDRKQRSKKDRQTEEYALTATETFENLILLSLYPRSQIQIFVYLLEMDGGVRSAILNACCLALADAGIAMKELVSACSVTFIDNRVLTDPNSIELNAGGAEVTMAIESNSEKLLCVELNSRFPTETLENMYEACRLGCKEILEVMKAAIKEKALTRLQGMHSFHR